MFVCRPVKEYGAAVMSGSHTRRTTLSALSQFNDTFLYY